MNLVPQFLPSPLDSHKPISRSPSRTHTRTSRANNYSDSIDSASSTPAANQIQNQHILNSSAISLTRSLPHPHRIAPPLSLREALLLSTFGGPAVKSRLSRLGWKKFCLAAREFSLEEKPKPPTEEEKMKEKEIKKLEETERRKKVAESLARHRLRRAAAAKSQAIKANEEKEKSEEIKSGNESEDKPTISSVNTSVLVSPPRWLSEVREERKLKAELLNNFICDIQKHQIAKEELRKEIKIIQIKEKEKIAKRKEKEKLLKIEENKVKSMEIAVSGNQKSAADEEKINENESGEIDSTPVVNEISSPKESQSVSDSVPVEPENSVVSSASVAVSVSFTTRPSETFLTLEEEEEIILPNKIQEEQTETDKQTKLDDNETATAAAETSNEPSSEENIKTSRNQTEPVKVVEPINPIANSPPPSVPEVSPSFSFSFSSAPRSIPISSVSQPAESNPMLLHSIESSKNPSSSTVSPSAGGQINSLDSLLADLAAI